MDERLMDILLLVAGFAIGYGSVCLSNAIIEWWKNHES